jgi:hypothetical protein
MPAKWAPRGDKLGSRSGFSAYFTGRLLESKRRALRYLPILLAFARQ